MFYTNILNYPECMEGNAMLLFPCNTILVVCCHQKYAFMLCVSLTLMHFDGICSRC